MIVSRKRNAREGPEWEHTQEKTAAADWRAVTRVRVDLRKWPWSTVDPWSSLVAARFGSGRNNLAGARRGFERVVYVCRGGLSVSKTPVLRSFYCDVLTVVGGLWVDFRESVLVNTF